MVVGSARVCGAGEREAGVEEGRERRRERKGGRKGERVREGGRWMVGGEGLPWKAPLLSGVGCRVGVEQRIFSYSRLPA